MVKLSKLYTGVGDKGETYLVGGALVSKCSLRVQAYGDIDELNSHIGAARTSMIDFYKEQESQLAKIQNELFDIGSLLATAPNQSWEGMPRIDENHIRRLETDIDALTMQVPELRSFVLPGGSALNAQLHIARTICRRAERHILLLHKEESVQDSILVYVNRLSDYLFALARFVIVAEKKDEFLWVPGGESAEKAPQA